MRFIRSRVLVVFCVAIVASAVLGVGVAWAYGGFQNPIDGSGVIHGCYSPRDGDIHLLVRSSCSHYETEITWNQQGVKGDKGDQGVKGDKGDKGDPGSGSSLTTQVVTSTETNFDLGACDTAPCASHHTGYAYCPTGKLVLGGGVTTLGVDNGPTYYANGGAVVVHNSKPETSGSPQGWSVDVISPTESGATHITMTVYAICTA